MNAEADRKAQELIELRNKAETLIYGTERTMRETGDKIGRQGPDRQLNDIHATRSLLRHAQCCVEASL